MPNIEQKLKISPEEAAKAAQELIESRNAKSTPETRALVAESIRQMKRPILHNRKCINSTRKKPNGCLGGDQQVEEEYKYKKVHMVKLTCIPCKKSYSMSISLL